jgi:hypothetical protein
MMLPPLYRLATTPHRGGAVSNAPTTGGSPRSGSGEPKQEER